MALSDNKTSARRVRLPLVQEQVRVGKRRRATGKVRVRTVVDETKEIASGTLQEEHAEVTRIPVNRPVSEVPGVRTADDVTIVPVLEEVLVIEKQLILKEELHIRRRVTTEKVQLPVSLKKQRAIIERVEPEAKPRK